MAENGISWTEYFYQISSSLLSCGRQYGIANGNFGIPLSVSIIMKRLDNVTSVIHNARVSELSYMEESLLELRTYVTCILHLYLAYQIVPVKILLLFNIVLDVDTPYL